MKKGQVYKGFEVLDVKRIPDCKSTGIYLKHKESGMEVFHLLNKDPENLFSFTFNTPPSNSTGVAHVIEHSVLCGSKKYPLKDPFIQLSKQSINTYLNAYTSVDRTVYPASSVEKADYYNLMSVYADAVFFPLLKKEIFSQECCRLEYDNKNKPSLQGVVYNEMKGVFSSLYYLANKADCNSLSKDSCYGYVSGGDPLEIPNLTYKEFKAFHKKYYCTANCRVFLYGDIATEEQLDFLNENIIAKCKSWGKPAVIDFESPEDEPEHYVEAYGPCEEKEDSKCVVDLNWKVPAKETKKDISLMNIELLFLINTLWRNDSTPVGKALRKSGLGAELSPNIGCTLARLDPVITVGMAGVEKEKAEEIRKVVIAELERIVREGLTEDEIETSLMDFEFMNREIVRMGGPYSMVYMRQALRSWCYGDKPWKIILFSQALEKLKKRIKEDPSYINQIIKKYLLDNPLWTLVTTIPDPDWNKKREEDEQKIIQKIISKSSPEELKALVEEMHDFQNKEESASKLNCIPHLKASDLKKKYNFIKTSRLSLSGIPLLLNNENTNGITYVRILFPADVLKAEDYLYLPVFCSLVTKCGWKGLSWDQGVLKIQKVTGSFSCYIKSSDVAKKCQDYVKENPLEAGREWIVFSFNYLNEYEEKVFALLEDFFNKVDFKDLDRIRTSIKAMYSAAASQLSASSYGYISTRACSRSSRNGAVSELIDGYSQILALKKMNSMPVKKIARKLRKIFAQVKKGGSLIQVIGEKESLDGAKVRLSSFIDKVHLCPLKAKRKIPVEKFYSLTDLNDVKDVQVINKHNPDFDEVFIITGGVGYAAHIVKNSGWDTKEFMEDELYSHYLENTDLWQRVRTEGGAYGVSMSVSGDREATLFATYRDPKPFDSVDTCLDIIKNFDENNLDRDVVEKSVIGLYSYMITPDTPEIKGSRALTRELYGHTNEDNKRYIDRLFELTVDDMKESIARYKKAKKEGKTVIAAPQSFITEDIKKRCGKIIILTL
ncbi:insulinase family protein [Treponema sp.]|uniref:insulinase family protein n=1 Tax=Treponema sp. TaxID=166 RepID=UPI0025D87327|nr:insulinase family protein [Treponema sp.]MCR5219094.1 insulinase family protein [Treponema sp.]